MRRAVMLLCALAAWAAVRSAPVPSRAIYQVLDPVVVPRWQWAQGETVYVTVTARMNAVARDLTGSTCYGVLYSGTSTWWYSTGVVSSATGGVFAVTVTNSQSNVSETNAYDFAFYASGTTSSAYLGKAAVAVLYAPDASAPRVAAADQIATSTILTGGVTSAGARLPATNHVFYLPGSLRFSDGSELISFGGTQVLYVTSGASTNQVWP